MDEDPLLKEYYEIYRTVNEFDKNLLTVKGWGVTLALLALAWGFRDGHLGLFLVGALGGLSFWLIEGVMKRHQMRFYLRMREIEVLRLDQIADEKEKKASSPRIDSSWYHAGRYYRRGKPASYRPTILQDTNWGYHLVWFFPHVAFPHCVSVLAGFVFFLMGYCGKLGAIEW